MAATQRSDLPGITVVVPVKRLARAKSRLDLPPRLRRQVALQLAAGTVRTLLATPSVTRVLVVTSDPTVARFAQMLGAGVVREPRPRGLNPAVDAGRRAALLLAPRDDIAVLVSDLPEITTGEVEEVVEQFRRTRRPLLVADHEGTGTTALLHSCSDRPPARFGPGSAVRHREAGYRPATGLLPGLRQDLDSLDSGGFAAVARALHLFSDDRSTERQEAWVPHS